MPRTLELPKQPEVVFGIMHRAGVLGENPHGYSAGPYRPGWFVRPHYTFGHHLVAGTKHEAEARLPEQVAAWQRRVLTYRRASATMAEVLVDRIITHVEMGGYGPIFYFVDGTSVRLERTRGYQRPIMQGPMTGPFRIRRILADQRTFRLFEGESLVFNCKLHLREETIPTWILDQIFPL
jgi:hypothetical protein